MVSKHDDRRSPRTPGQLAAAEPTPGCGVSLCSKGGCLRSNVQWVFWVGRQMSNVWNMKRKPAIFVYFFLSIHQDWNLPTDLTFVKTFPDLLFIFSNRVQLHKKRQSQVFKRENTTYQQLGVSGGVMIWRAWVGCVYRWWGRFIYIYIYTRLKSKEDPFSLWIFNFSDPFLVMSDFNPSLWGRWCAANLPVNRDMLSLLYDQMAMAQN